MAVTLTAALDGSGNVVTNANTYGTLAEADAYFAIRPNASAWAAETDNDVRSGYLLWAMKSLLGLGWIGGRLQFDQPLDWPRVAIRPSERCNASYPYGTYYGSGLYTGAGLWIPSNTIPQAVKNAQFEFAFATQGSAAMSSAEKYKRKIITDANGTLEFNVGAENVASLNSLAMRELRGLLLTSAGVKLTARAG